MRNFVILRDDKDDELKTAGSAAKPTADSAKPGVDDAKPADDATKAKALKEQIAEADAAIAKATSFGDRLKAITAREKLTGARVIKSVSINCSISDDVIPRVTFSLENRYKVLTDDGDALRSVFSQSSYGVFDIIRHKGIFQGIVKDLEAAPKLLARILSGCTITAMLKDVAKGEVAKNPFSEKQTTYAAKNASTWFFLLDIVPNERAKQLIDKIYFGEVDISRFARPASPVAAPAATSESEDVPF